MRNNRQTAEVLAATSRCVVGEDHAERTRKIHVARLAVDGAISTPPGSQPSLTNVRCASALNNAMLVTHKRHHNDRVVRQLVDAWCRHSSLVRWILAGLLSATEM